MINNIKDLLNTHTQQSLKKIQGIEKAGVAWNTIATKKERKHTQAVFVKENKTRKYPTLIIYIDCSTLLQDYQTNHIWYEQKLFLIGYPVEKVIFKLSKKIPKIETEHTLKKAEGKKNTSITLSNKEKERIQSITQKINEPLRTILQKTFLELRKQELYEKHNI